MSFQKSISYKNPRHGAPGPIGSSKSRYVFFCFVVAIFELVHNVEAIFHLLNCKQYLEIFSEI